MKITNGRILFREDEKTLISFYSLWKIKDLISLSETHLALVFSNITVVIDFVKIKTKNRFHDVFLDVKNKKKLYFSTMPLTVADQQGLQDSMGFLVKIYKETKFPLPKPKIWGRETPPFYEEMGMFRYEKIKKVGTKPKTPTRVLRRKSLLTLKTIDLDDVLMSENLIPIPQADEMAHNDEPVDDHIDNQNETQSEATDQRHEFLIKGVDGRKFMSIEDDVMSMNMEFTKNEGGSERDGDELKFTSAQNTPFLEKGTRKQMLLDVDDPEIRRRADSSPTHSKRENRSFNKILPSRERIWSEHPLDEVEEEADEAKEDPGLK